jgi:3-hydroxypropanoate dehydrogenase
MNSALPSESLNQLFLTARTPGGWTDFVVSDDLVFQLYNLLKFGPTASNSCPARFVWVRTQEGKERLASVAVLPNRFKILSAPLTVIVGYDLDFGETLPKLLLQPERVAMVQDMLKAPGLAETMGMRNGSLQGAYLILAARALGLDCWPMSGFDNDGVDREFFAGTQIKSNFICSLGYSNPELAHPRGPRLGFEETSQFA